MQNNIVYITSITELHDFYGYGKPKHPLISVVDLNKIDRSNYQKYALGTSYRMGFYTIFCKKFKGNLKYGKSYYDFNEGSLIFIAPDQLVSSDSETDAEEGWALFFHPDLLNTSPLGSKMNDYTFFHYDTNEALHLSDEEKGILKDCLKNIEREYSQNIDHHTHSLIQSNIELLLNYCERFYGRQFITRIKGSKDIVQRFESAIKLYFQQETLIEKGIPDVKYFANELCLSPNYLSDLLKRHTGKTTHEYIHLQLLEKAKMLLWSSEKSVSEIAYELGFGHPSHFNKIFKGKLGLSPKQYRIQRAIPG